MSNEQTQEKQEKVMSPFEEIRHMDVVKAVNVMIQAANAAQRAGALAMRDSVLVARAAEYLIEIREEHIKSNK